MEGGLAVLWSAGGGGGREKPPCQQLLNLALQLMWQWSASCCSGLKLEHECMMYVTLSSSTIVVFTFLFPCIFVQKINKK